MEGLAGSLHGQLDVRGIGLCDFGEHFAGSRVDGLEAFAGYAIDPFVVDQNLCLLNQICCAGWLGKNSGHGTPSSEHEWDLSRAIICQPQSAVSPERGSASTFCRVA